MTDAITLFTVALAVLLSGAVATAQVSYFPPETLGDTAQSSQFKEQWYTQHLLALKEPSLWQSSRTQTTQTYRFLWLRTFLRPIAVRLGVNKDGTGVLTTKIASGQGGYDPGLLITNKSRKMKREETIWFLDILEELAFWSLPVYEQRGFLRT